MKVNRFCFAASALVALFFMTGCTRDFSPNLYRSDNVGDLGIVKYGVVKTVTVVDIKEHRRVSDNKAGMGTGAVLGGLLGSAAGGGSGKLLTTGIGAVAGGVAGMYAEDSLRSHKGMRYTVLLDSGETVSIVQSLEPSFAIGQRVRVIMEKGRSYLVSENG